MSRTRKTATLAFWVRCETPTPLTQHSLAMETWIYFPSGSEIKWDKAHDETLAAKGYGYVVASLPYPITSRKAGVIREKVEAYYRGIRKALGADNN